MVLKSQAKLQKNGRYVWVLWLYRLRIQIRQVISCHFECWATANLTRVDCSASFMYISWYFYGFFV